MTKHKTGEPVSILTSGTQDGEGLLNGKLGRRDFLDAGIKLGLGASALGMGLGTLGLPSSAFAAEGLADSIIGKLNLPYGWVHNAPDPKTLMKTPAGKYKKAGPWKVGFSNNYSSNSWRTNMLWCLKYYATKHADKISELLYTDSNLDISKQISDIQSLEARGIDVLLLEPSVGSALNPVVNRLQAKGIPVIPFDGVLKGANYAVWVGMNLRYIGVASAKFLIDHLGNKGNILICRGQAGNFIDTLWWEAAEKVLKASGLKIVGQVYTNWDFATGKQNVSKFLASHSGKIDGVWNENGAAAMGIIEAFEDANRPVPPTMGDQNNGFLKKWSALAKKNGYQAHGYIYPTWLSSDALEIAFKILSGESVYHDTFIPLEVITNATLHKYVKPSVPDSYFSVDYLPEAWIKRMYAEKISFGDVHK